MTQAPERGIIIKIRDEDNVAIIANAGGLPAGVRLELDVASPSWVEVYAPGGKRLYYDLAGAGQTLSFDRPRGPITVFLGNVAGVRVKLNGAAFEIPDSDVSGKTARFEVTAPAPPAASSSP